MSGKVSKSAAEIFQDRAPRSASAHWRRLAFTAMRSRPLATASPSTKTPSGGLDSIPINKVPARSTAIGSMSSSHW